MEYETTIAVPFCHIPADDGHLLRVNASINTGTVLFRADQISDHVRNILCDSMMAAQASEDPIYVSIHYETIELLHFLLGMANALREAAGATA